MMRGGAGSSRAEPAARRGRQRTPNGQADRRVRSETLWSKESLIHVHAVFDLPELLEFILDYAIHDRSQEKHLKTLKSVRMVSKKWLTGVTNVMRKNREPLFKLTLTKDNSLNGTPFVEAEGKLLDAFVAVMGQRVEGPFPTFKLKILEEFFCRENYDSLLTCLRECGQGLVEMEIPRNGGSLPEMLPPVNLPMMNKLSTTFTHLSVDVPMPNIIGLIQAFLRGASSLKTFTIPTSIVGIQSIVYPAPRNIEFLSFPESITKLQLKCRMTSQNLEVLTRNQLPNLLTLELLFHNVSYAEGLLSKIMSNFSEHLRSLAVLSVSYRPPRQVNFVRFPVMKKLTQLDLAYNGLELEAGHPPLKKCFPKLEVLSLYQQTQEMLQKWTANTALNSVESLDLWLIDESKSERKQEYTLPFSLESMQRAHYSFPNITELTLRVLSGQEECGLKYLFDYTF